HVTGVQTCALPILCCVELPRLLPRIRNLLIDDDCEIVAAAAEVLGFHFEPLGEALRLLLASEDAHSRALALRLVPNEPDAKQYVRAVLAGLGEVEPQIVDAAIDAGVRLGLAQAWTRARERGLEAGGDDSMLLLGLRGEASDQALLLGALHDEKRRLAALWALSFVGTPEAVDAAI